MKATIGGDRLGSGNKQEVYTRTYNRSSHELDYLWRSTMAPGVLTPFLCMPALPGDSFDIDLSYDGKTLPTNGPLFGSFKVQIDLFIAPIKLYQAQLYFNKLEIGMKMNTIKLPQLRMEALSPTTDQEINDGNFQIHSSSVFSYLNMRGLGRNNETLGGTVTREFNGTAYLMLWDIYKNYYANKSEGIGAVIHNPMNSLGVTPIINCTFINDAGAGINIFNNATSFDLVNGNNELYVYFGSGITVVPDWREIILQIDAVVTLAHECFGFVEWQEEQKRYKFWELNQDRLGTHTWVCYTQDVPYLPPTFTNPLITTFPLTNLDEMREDILLAVRQTTPFIIDKDSITPYGLPFQKGDANSNAYCKRAPLEGLPVKTYQSDLFNNWVNTEWIDGVGGVAELSAVDTSTGSFKIDQLNIAQKVYNLFNRIALKGGSYEDWQSAAWEEGRKRTIVSPMYLGGLSKEIAFQEVISQNASNIDNTLQPLGTLAGRGVMTHKHKGGSVKVRVDEPSYIMGLISLTPRIDYSQGNQWDCNLKTMEDFHKPEFDGIAFQDLITDQMHWGDTTIANDETITFKSAGKTPAWINYMTNINQIRGEFAGGSQFYMVLDRRYEATVANGIKDLTTYIDPSKHNHIFADTRTDAQNFWSQLGVRINSRRLMSAKIIPNM